MASWTRIGSPTARPRWRGRAMRSRARKKNTACPAPCWRRSGGSSSNFGQEMGKRSLVQSLTTLACMGDRANYFRSELMATLKIIDRGDVPPEKLNGSWAGAFGQTQFMPSTFLRLAVDFEGDGRRDIVDFAPDALASTGELSCQIRLAPRPCLGLRGQAARGLWGPVRAQGQTPDVVLGVARPDPDRRAPARGRRSRASHTRGTRGPGLSGDAQFRRRLFL